MSSNMSENGSSITESKPWRLVIGKAAWEKTFRSLLNARRSWTVGSLSWNVTDMARELIARDVEVTSNAPQGNERHALADWIVFRILPSDQSLTQTTIEHAVHRLSPMDAQLLVVVLFDGQREGRCQAYRCFEGRAESFDDVRVIAPRMLQLGTDELSEPSGELDEIDAQRFSRLRPVLGDDVFDRIRASTITIVGAGRNGSKMAFEFAGIGIGHLRIVDPDTLAWENLNAMPGFCATDVGSRKAVTLARRLREFSPDIRVTVLDKSVKDNTAYEFLLQRSDLLVTAVDNDVPRLAATMAAVRTETVHLDVATSVQSGNDGSLRLFGDNRLFYPREGCCVCVGGLADLAETNLELQSPSGSLPRRRSRDWSDERLGSLGNLNSLVCGAAVQIWLDALMGKLRTSFWQRLSWRQGHGLIDDSGPVGPGDACPYCERAAAVS